MKSKRSYSFIKRVKHHLQVWHGLWSVPLGALLFILAGVGLQKIFGESIGFYDPSFLQVAFLAAFIFILFNSVAWFIFYFNFRHLHEYFLGAAKQDFDKLKEWQKICITLLLYFFFIVVLIILTKMFL